jgi:hypothetical protein
VIRDVSGGVGGRRLTRLPACAGSPARPSLPPDPFARARDSYPFDPYAAVIVGSYVVESDYWNEGICPGSQCMAINDATGAFSVTQAPNCGDTVASYPNVLYGCSFGTCSPASVLPMPIGVLTTVTSSRDFSVGGVSTDKYNVAYDI